MKRASHSFMRLFAGVTLAIILLNLDNSSAYATVGFQKLQAGNLTIGVWYPTKSQEQNGRLGPFDVHLAFDSAPLATGRFQPILMSHGNSGRMRNHHLTGKALADAGFIVIAPLHTVDHLVGSSDTYKAMNWRTIELAHALEAVIQIEAFRKIIDLTRIHTIGYSLGAITALNAAGAGIDRALVEKHCEKNKDPAFCDTPSWILRQKLKYFRDVTPPSLDREIPGKYYALPFINGGVGLIAPVGRGVVFDEHVFLAQKLFIIGFHGDVVTVPRFHAENLIKIFPGNLIEHFSLRQGHHSAFIAPFSKRVTDKEYIPAAQDPKGFDRKNFLKGLNEELVSFFEKMSK